MDNIKHIKWIDSGALLLGWFEPDEIEEDTPVQESAGYLVKETKNWIYLASSYDKDRNRYSGIVGIYKKNIVKRNK